MQVVLRHVQVRVTDHALDRRQVNPQRLHLADIGVAAGMRRQLTHTLDGSHILLELVPVVYGKNLNKGRFLPLLHLKSQIGHHKCKSAFARTNEKRPETMCI